MQRKLHDGLHLGSISRRRRGPFHRQNQCTWSRAAGESDACSRDLPVLGHVKLQIRRCTIAFHFWTILFTDSSPKCSTAKFSFRCKS